MDPLDLLLRLVLLPAAVCGAAWAVGRFACARSGERRDAAAAVGLAAAFCAGLYAVGTRPHLPLAPAEDGWTWVFWFAPAGAVLGIAGLAVRVPAPARHVLRAAAGAGAAWLLLRPLVPASVPATTALALEVASGVAVAVVWAAIARRAARPGWAGLALPVGVALLGEAVVLAQYGGSLVMAQAAGAMATGVGANALLARASGRPAVAAPSAPVVALALVGLLAGGHAYLNYGDVVRFPWLSAACLAAAPVAVLLPRAWQATALAVVLAAAAAAAAALLATGEPY